MPNDDAIRLTQPNRMEPVFLIGYDRQLEAGLALGIQTAKEGLSPRVLVFGYPGIAKTTYPRALAYLLNQNGFPYSLLEVKCAKLSNSLDPRDVRGKLAPLERDFIPQFKPLIIVLDEFDVISPIRVGGSASDFLCTWTMAFLDRSDDLLRGTIIFCITNDPSNLDPAIHDRLEMALYLDFTTKEMITGILKNNGIPDGKVEDVVSRLVETAAKNSVRYSGRTLQKGVEDALRFDPALVEKEPAGIADTICAGAAPTSSEKIEKYEAKHRARIYQSNLFLRLWCKGT
jgi:AAA+ superfamily predicted ATPase